MTEQAVIRQSPATYADVLAAPEHMVAELVDGALHLQPRPRSRHARAQFALAGRLEGPYGPESDEPGGWWFCVEPELHLGDDVVVPDLCGWRRERMPEFPDVAYFTLAPDWVCEILSPSTRRLDTTAKRDVYARAGVGHLWLIDPDAGTLEAFAGEPEGWRLIANLADGDVVTVAPFAAAGFRLSALLVPPG
ncbi:MAG: Uma2 family endonuclease [Paracoccaceae bacterium]